MITQWTDTKTAQWVDSETYSFIVEFGYTYTCVFTDNSYIYNSYNKVLEIYDFEDHHLLNTVNYDFNITSLCANEDRLFLGTTVSGLLCLDKEILSNYPTNSDILNSTYIFKNYPDITSNNINYVCCQGDLVSLCTDIGVDFIKLEPNGYSSYTTVSGAQKSFILSERELYYIIDDLENTAVYKEDPITNWTSENNILSEHEDITGLLDYITDIKATKNPTGEDIIFLLTNIGVLIKQEDEFIWITKQ
jgi:hypothetical protein